MNVRKRGETAGAHGLLSVDFGEIGLVHGARAYVLRLHAAGLADLVLDAQAPLHEIRCVESTIRHSSHGYWRKTSSRVRQRRRTRELARSEAGGESLISGDGGIDRTVRHTGRHGCAANCS